MLTLSGNKTLDSGKGCEPSVAGGRGGTVSPQQENLAEFWKILTYYIKSENCKWMAANHNANAPAHPAKGKLQPKAWSVPSSCSHARHGEGTVQDKPCPCFWRPAQAGASLIPQTQTDSVVTVGGDVSQTLTHFYLQAWVHASPKLPHTELFRRMKNMFKKNDIWESHNLSASFSPSSVNSQQVSYSLPILCLPFLLCEFPVSFSL